MDFLKLLPANSLDEVCEKMRKKIVISMAVVTLLLMGIMATSVLASDLTLAKNTSVSKELQVTAESAAPEKLVQVSDLSPASVIADDSQNSVIPDEVEELPEIDVENLRETVPRTYEETDVQLSTQRIRFLLYTHDGKHVMWGFGNGYFVGTDNLGKRCWGIYGNGVFAGLYDGEFFWGRYRSGNWNAEGLFGANYAHGKYILFSTADIAPAITATNP